MIAAASLPRGIGAWLSAARPATLPASLVPVLVGGAVAARGGSFHLARFTATLAAALLIQIGTNFANDYSDFLRGADNADRLGPVRLAASGVVAPHVVLRAAILVFAAAAAIGVYLVIVAGWPILVIGVASIVAGAAYTGGRFAFGYVGLGDLVCFVFFGVIAVNGAYLVQSGGLAIAAFMASVPVGCLVTAILVVNNVRDIGTDRAAGKRTLAVRIGRRATRWEFAALVSVAYLWLPLLVVSGAARWWLFWLPLATIPLALSVINLVASRAGGRSLNVALKATGRLHLYFGVLLATSLLR